jgi:ankyrin repeat protein|eukprot:COSAG02_NODE_5219_length_4528_cov_2.614811_2_plen_221_part_00
MARMLIHAGAAINPPRTPMSSPLAMAAQVGAFDIVSYLLENDADVNSRCEAGGNTPLMVVLSKVGRDPTMTPTAELIAFDIAAELIEAGADVNIVNHNGFSCLHEASEYGYDRILKLMLSKGGDVELKLPRGQHTAFHLACESGHFGCVQLLVRAGCDTTAQTEDGLTGLQILKDCARTGTDVQQPANWQIAQWLLEEMAAGRIAEEEPDYIEPGQCAQQ